MHGSSSAKINAVSAPTNAHGVVLYRNARWSTRLRLSFPSGHTISAFAFSIAVGSYYPYLMGVLLFCAFSIATSRIVLGMHFLSDVVVGALLGAGLGYAGFVIFM